MNANCFEFAAEVRQALDAGQPVVALESTIIAHGMPYPANVETALEVERIIKEAGAQPATIGILDGHIHVGLSAAQIEQLATRTGVMKACERDLPLAVARSADAAATAGATLAIAASSGIGVFVTGGIGAVGPHARQDFDISADLTALERHSAITVCAGAKAFMDTAATLEWLETHAVQVATWQADEFPLFFLRSSGVPTPWRVDQPEELASTLRARRRLGMSSGILLGVPLPKEDTLDADETQKAIEEALRWADAGAVSGKRLTPFLLARINDITAGRSLAANQALIRNNARVGAAIARALTPNATPC